MKWLWTPNKILYMEGFYNAPRVRSVFKHYYPSVGSPWPHTTWGDGASAWCRGIKGHLDSLDTWALECRESLDCLEKMMEDKQSLEPNSTHRRSDTSICASSPVRLSTQPASFQIVFLTSEFKQTSLHLSKWMFWKNPLHTLEHEDSIYWDQTS